MDKTRANAGWRWRGEEGEGEGSHLGVKHNHRVLGVKTHHRARNAAGRRFCCWSIFDFEASFQKKLRGKQNKC